MREIPLTQGKTALVDDKDYERVMQYKWYACKPRNVWYATRSVRVVPKKQGSSIRVYMHVFIIGQKGIDHANGNGLDNRRSNLRVATHSQNVQNTPVRRNSRSGYKGVSWHTLMGRWRVRIQVDGTQMGLGYFHDLSDAARAYNEAARKYHGRFARLNVIPTAA